MDALDAQMLDYRDARDENKRRKSVWPHSELDRDPYLYPATCKEYVEETIWRMGRTQHIFSSAVELVRVKIILTLRKCRLGIFVTNFRG